MLFKWIVGICITIIVIFSSIVGGKKLLAYVEKENENIQIERAANEKEKKAAEEAPQISEGEIISTMHKMVHQKVKSSEKWGFVEMTKKEISNVKRDIENWLPKVRKGGILAGHDYVHTWPGVIQAVNESVSGFITMEQCWVKQC